MPWIVGPTGPYKGQFLYTLPPGLTGVGTLGQVVAFLLDDFGFPTTDPGVTGVVWNNNFSATVSKGTTGP